MSDPHGVTSKGTVVHRKTSDHHADHSRYQRFNKACAVWITKNVGTMTAFWVFTGLSMLVVPSCLYEAGYISTKAFYTTFGFNLLCTLILSTWLELALMPAIMVGQNLQSAAADARAEKEFEDIEKLRDDLTTALDRLDTETEGGLQTVLEAIGSLKERRREG